ncbi:endonuclease/exonuclease/phosphatase family metal-dependent hydrolase [Pontibacter ummariensis]|uniref:Metal-dependent hydrolase, endonuclease/exonuclease/phosphatase family n=1 Tax=Pontibacter ummariensis TaxID=1610492 RepID=A0A239G3L2_9BACT|nr:endonuclease/exonuclease/phosphatase family protein [Pontibacter ummariensis]PRY11674.1 endonuclease/exonuclease/phosphatase family metal-dependent hydrolase [Pontibacter ummariensis]SNS63192.1 Metal-dependent hydrolase, endonuclease/exonuclease/phosphatase family [Pontibacter ummariensis]
MKKVFLALAVMLSLHFTGASAQTFRVATYNIRYDNKSDTLNAWHKRLPVMTDLIKFHDFDIFGSQEGLHHQLEALAIGLEDYAYIGVGRDDGKQAGEFSAIFYKKDKFRLLQKGNFWLSPVTDRPNKGWDAALPRICSWGQFQDIASGFKFYLFNVHFDHQGVQARKESAKLVLHQIKKIAGDTPVVLTGDFNLDQTDEGYAVLSKSNLVQDAYNLSPVRYAPNGTFNGFNINIKSDKRIDHIFLTPHFKTKRYGILTDSYQGQLPSDHFPVAIEVAY